jgi:hypothetical protein
VHEVVLQNVYCSPNIGGMRWVKNVMGGGDKCVHNFVRNPIGNIPLGRRKLRCTDDV